MTVMDLKHSRVARYSASDRNVLVLPPKENPGGQDMWWNQCTAYSFHPHCVFKMDMESVTLHTALVTNINNALGLSKLKL